MSFYVTISVILMRSGCTSTGRSKMRQNRRWNTKLLKRRSLSDSGKIITAEKILQCTSLPEYYIRHLVVVIHTCQQTQKFYQPSMHFIFDTPNRTFTSKYHQVSTLLTLNHAPGTVPLKRILK